MEWNDATKVFPKEGETVIGANNESTYIAGVEYIHEEKRWYMYGDYYSTNTEVLYWMPFPEPPKL